MSVQTQARSLLMKHHKMVMNRERSMLARTAAEIGVDVDRELLLLNHRLQKQLPTQKPAR